MHNPQGHPKALPFLFFTEMWERVGFYVVQGMLVLYMTQQLGYSDELSYSILGAFSALAYISPVVGGLLADRVIGFKKAIVLGGILLSSGYALLAAPWGKSFYIGLGIIIIGNGFFKPNISSLLGALYKHGNSDRDAGFTIFYIGINLGVIIAGVGSSLIRTYLNWQANFLFASIGLIIGLITFFAAVRWGDMDYRGPFLKLKKLLITKIYILTGCAIAVILLSYLLQSATLSKWIFSAVGIFLLFFMFFIAFRQDKMARNNLIVVNILILSVVIFWMIQLQMLFSVNLFVERLVQRQMGGFQIPTPLFYTLGSIFIITLGPLFAWLWHTLYKHKCNPSPLSKFVLGIFIVGLAPLSLAAATLFPNAHNLINPLWVVLSYLLVTIGELCMIPIGLAAITELSPPHLTGMMMGIWFAGMGFGGEFAGLIAKVTSIPAYALNQPLKQLTIYRHGFTDQAVLAFAIAIILFIIQWALKKTLNPANKINKLA